MPELRLIPLEEVLSAADMRKLRHELSELGVSDFPTGDDVLDIDDAMNEEQLADFIDHLDAHEIACDIYLPVEFDGRIAVGDHSVGSTYALSEALEEIREELDIDEEPEPDDDGEEESDMDVIDQQLAYIWQVFVRAASASATRQVPLLVLS